MKQLFLYICALALFVGTMGLPVRAQVFTENFGTLANGTALTTLNTSLNYARVSTGSGSFLYATNDQFSGASALLYSSSGSLTGLGTSNLTAFTVGTLSFSLFSSSTLNSLSIFTGTGATFYNNSTFSGNDLTTGFQFVSGQLQTRNSANSWVNVGAVGFGANTTYNISIVFNDSASTVNYASGTLAAGTADFWVNGSLFGDDVSIRGAQATTGFRIYTTSSSSPIEVDNINLYDSAVAVPEPSTFVLAALGGLGCLIVLHKRRR